MSTDQTPATPVTVLISPQGDWYATADPHEVNNLTLGHSYQYAPTSAPDDPKLLDLTGGAPYTGTGLFESHAQSMRHLHRVSAPLRAGTPG